MKLIKLILIITVCVTTVNAQQTPADQQSKSIAIIGCLVDLALGTFISLENNNFYSFAIL